MTDEVLSTSHHPSCKVAAESASGGARLIPHVQWALALACAYLVFGRQSSDAVGLCPLVVAGFLAVNLVIRAPHGRSRRRVRCSGSPSPWSTSC
jgi:hypothetical protein